MLRIVQMKLTRYIRKNIFRWNFIVGQFHDCIWKREIECFYKAINTKSQDPSLIPDVLNIYFQIEQKQ